MSTEAAQERLQCRAGALQERMPQHSKLQRRFQSAFADCARWPHPSALRVRLSGRVSSLHCGCVVNPVPDTCQPNVFWLLQPSPGDLSRGVVSSDSEGTISCLIRMPKP